MTNSTATLITGKITNAEASRANPQTLVVLEYVAQKTWTIIMRSIVYSLTIITDWNYEICNFSFSFERSIERPLKGCVIRT